MTKIELDDQLITEALNLTHLTTTKRGLVELALREFIDNHRRKDVRDLIGKIKINFKYRYKKLRMDSRIEEKSIRNLKATITTLKVSGDNNEPEFLKYDKW